MIVAFLPWKAFPLKDKSGEEKIIYGTGYE